MKLIVDFDGTLHRSDLLWELFVRKIFSRPTSLIPLLYILFTKGKANFKSALMDSRLMGNLRLPWNSKVLEFIQSHPNTDPPFVVTAGDQSSVAAALGSARIDLPVMGSTPGSNLKGTNKLRAIKVRFPGESFCYIGDSAADLPVWQHSEQTGFVGTDRKRKMLERRLGKKFDWTFISAEGERFEFLRAMRPHQWIKNTLIFLPVLAAHRWGDLSLWISAFIAFLCFCTSASGVYLINDLCDLDSDRSHPSKKSRSLARGTLDIPVALGLSFFLFLISLLLAIANRELLSVLLLYWLLTTLYSFKIKRMLAIDIVTLSVLYTLRIIAGGAATGIVPSVWLLVFAGFFFLSLAAAKRFSDLVLHGEIASSGRAYLPQHLLPVAAIGSASAMTSVLVIALYTREPDLDVYLHPEYLLLTCPVLLYWFSRLWLMASDGRIDSDPVLFAARDKVSWACAGLIALIGLFASLL